MEITKEEITRMVQEAYTEGFNTAIECLKSAKDGITQTFAAQQSVQSDDGYCHCPITKTEAVLAGSLCNQCFRPRR